MSIVNKANGDNPPGHLGPTTNLNQAQVFATWHKVSDLEPLDLDLASPFTRSVLGVIELVVLSLISSGKDGKDRCRASRVTPGRPARVSCYFRASGQLVNKLSYWEELPWKLCVSAE